ncbi:MAG: MIP/aquaporin family protein [Gemmatimonadales bacterium]
MNTTVIRPLAAECLGTFGLIFIGAGAVLMDSHTGGALGLLGVALAHALVLSIMVTATMNISGGHVNPAVTLALFLAKKVDGKLAGMYVLAQLLGAVAAALLVRWLLPSAAGELTSYGAPKIAPEINMLQAIAIEMVLTFFLVSAVFGTAVSSEAPSVGGFGIGLVLLFDILVGGPLTGAAMNPARAFGPALISMDFEGHVAYWAGPLLGGALAAGLWAGVLLPRKAA